MCSCCNIGYHPKKKCVIKLPIMPPRIVPEIMSKIPITVIVVLSPDIAVKVTRSRRYEPFSWNSSVIWNLLSKNYKYRKWVGQVSILLCRTTW